MMFSLASDKAWRLVCGVLLLSAGAAWRSVREASLRLASDADVSGSTERRPTSLLPTLALCCRGDGVRSKSKSPSGRSLDLPLMSGVIFSGSAIETALVAPDLGERASSGAALASSAAAAPSSTGAASGVTAATTPLSVGWSSVFASMACAQRTIRRGGQ
ncbi:hypothetical protein BDY21DRAFT_330139 [Lineolata rhizophorae]|uniref:Uncharacterized protein n=1 Tax=Lineolata rhizophorae TaxID=578093 RepID=A0A6A6PDA6_9PEZI|nr:hypothetical protein BDY21DRAFT_330139 [Lineolata rhizophorae]